MHPVPGSPSRATRSLLVRAAVAALMAVALAACAAGSTATPGPSGPPPTGILLPAVTDIPSGAAGASPSIAASPASASSPTPAVVFPLTVKDDEGTAVTLAAQPKRIVSLTPAETEILFALGDGDRIVARSEDPTPYPPAAAALPVVTTMGAVNVEKIVASSPDLVVAGGLGFTSSDAIAKLRGLGIPVVVFYASDVAGVLQDVRITSNLLGQPAAGNDLATTMKSQLDAVSAAATAAGGTPPRVFYEIDATKEIYGPADASFLAEMIKLAGGDPITTGSATAYVIPLERLITADPQVILLGDAAYGTTADQVKARSGWATMTAVKTGAIRPVDDVVVTRPGPRLAVGLRDLALAINPNLVLPSLAAPSGSPVASPSP